MDEKTKCCCGHEESRHHAAFCTCGGTMCHNGTCFCNEFRHAEEAKPEPTPENVYERAREALVSLSLCASPWTSRNHDLIARAINSGERAEKSAEAAERTGQALVATAEWERDTAVKFAEKRASDLEAQLQNWKARFQALVGADSPDVAGNAVITLQKNLQYWEKNRNMWRTYAEYTEKEYAALKRGAKTLTPKVLELETKISELQEELMRIQRGY